MARTAMAALLEQYRVVQGRDFKMALLAVIDLVARLAIAAVAFGKEAMTALAEEGIVVLRPFRNMTFITVALLVTGGAISRLQV